MSAGRSVSYAFAAVPVPTQTNSILSSPVGQSKRYAPSVAMKESPESAVTSRRELLTKDGLKQFG